MLNIQIDNVREALAAVAFRFQNEGELQEGIAIALERAGISHVREVVLSKADRIDFMLDGGVGVEVKIDGSITSLTRQLYRYAQRPEVAAVVVVVSRMRLTNLPTEMNGKPIRVVNVIRAFA